MIKLKKLFQHRFGPLAVLFFVIIFLSFLVRCALLVKSWNNVDANFFQYIGIFLVGFFYDVVIWSFFAIPIALYCWLMKDSWYRTTLGRILLLIIFFIIVLILVFSACGEIVFWNEFNVRYNFIAVDYLVYTNEVVQNIIESYNFALIVALILFATIVIIFVCNRYIKLSQLSTVQFKKRSRIVFLYLILPCVAYFLVSNSFKNISKNNYVNELAGNGVYEFGSAFWNNEIDYGKFYATRNDTINISIIKKMMEQNAHFINKDVLSVEREIKSDSLPNKWNVVLISVESLSGDYMKHFGGTENITPFLDSLIPHSLFFENFYASGTRTVRGLEALSLAIPPTPGQSIVRRKNNEDMFTLGNVLLNKGYEVNYIYGGNAFFDNMGKYFGSNGYKVLDKRDIPDSVVTHTTAWGVDDEASFKYTLQQCDRAFANNKLFFNHIMTVSNHRPFTYPEGRIDIPSKLKVYEGGVKYTDYAINYFLQQAKTKPWFNNTIFVIVADHCSSSAGKTDLPVNRYHIPCFIYSPTLISPKIENRKISQIDLAPTILGFLNQSYTSKFLGSDIYKRDSVNDRLFISTYQNLGYIKNDTMVMLSPRKKVETFVVDYKTGNNKQINENLTIVNEAIAWYQSAYYLFSNKKNKK